MDFSFSRSFFDLAISDPRVNTISSSSSSISRGLTPYVSLLTPLASFHRFLYDDDCRFFFAFPPLRLSLRPLLLPPSSSSSAFSPLRELLFRGMVKFLLVKATQFAIHNQHVLRNSRSAKYYSGDGVRRVHFFWTHY